MIVFTNGCFDILHRGHFELLNYCAQKGAYVVVGLNSDSSIKRLKGPDRPINNQEDRAYALRSLSSVSEVCIFDEDTPYQLIEKIQPNIIVKGGDYKKEDVVGNNLAEVDIFNYINGYSTTNIISKNDAKQPQA